MKCQKPMQGLDEMRERALQIDIYLHLHINFDVISSWQNIVINLDKL
jgi:hypothetical protein